MHINLGIHFLSQYQCVNKVGSYVITQDKQKFERKIVNILIPIRLNICFIKAVLHIYLKAFFFG